MTRRLQQIGMIAAMSAWLAVVGCKDNGGKLGYDLGYGAKCELLAKLIYGGPAKGTYAPSCYAMGSVVAVLGEWNALQAASRLDPTAPVPRDLPDYLEQRLAELHETELLAQLRAHRRSSAIGAPASPASR